MANDNKSIAHTKWNCKYHIVFAPKYRRKVFFWRETRGHRENTEAVMRMEGDRDNRGRSMPGPCAYAGKYTAKDCSIEFHGIPEREEQPNDLRTIREPEIQVQGKRILVPRILRRYGGQEQTKDCRVYQTSTGRGQVRRTDDDVW